MVRPKQNWARGMNNFNQDLEVLNEFFLEVIDGRCKATRQTKRLIPSSATSRGLIHGWLQDGDPARAALGAHHSWSVCWTGDCYSSGITTLPKNSTLQAKIAWRYGLRRY